MQLRSHRRSRHEDVPPEDENSLNITTIPTTTATTMNTTIRNNITTSTISNSTSLLMGVVVSNDVTTVNQNHYHRRCRNDRRSHSITTTTTTDEVVVPNILHPQLPILSSSSISSSTMSSSSTSSNSGSCDSIPSEHTQVQARRQGQRSGLTLNINSNVIITSATSSSSSHAAAVAADALVEHPVIETTEAVTADATHEVTPAEPLSSFAHRNLTIATTAAAAAAASSSSSIVVVSSQPPQSSPPTSPPRSAPTLTCTDDNTHPDGTSGSDHGTTSQYSSSYTSPLPTLMGRHHQLDATNNNSHIRSPLMEQQHSEQHQDHSRLNFHRHNRRRSCSTLSPPPPPQSRRASLTLASFHGHNNHNSDSNATMNHNNGNSSNTGTRRRNSVATSSMNSSNNSNDVDSQYPSFEYRSSMLQHYRRFPSSQVNNTSATAESQSFDGFPLLPIPSLQPSDVPLPIHANRSAAVATIATNDSTIPSTANTATNNATTIPYPIDVVLPPLPFFTAGTSISTPSNVASIQTDSTAVDETISTTQPSPRRSSARLAAVEAQKKQQQDEVVDGTLDRRKAPPSSRNSSKKRPPKPNNDKDIFIVEDDCDDDKKCKAREMCCICMSYPDDDNEPMATLSNCVHEFCTHCIMKWADTENSCPLCKQRFTSIIIHRKSHNCSSNHIPNETSNSKKRAKTTSRNRRDNGTKKSPKPYQKIVIQVPTRNQRSEAGMVLDTILQSLTTTNGIIAAAANFAADGGNVNINPFMSFNFGLRPNDNQNPYFDFTTATRASFESGIRAGSTAPTTQTQQQQRGPPHPFVFAGASSLLPSMIRSQVAQDRTTSFPLPQQSNIGTNTNSTTGNTTANSSQYHFHPAPQPSPNESLFANFLSTTMTRPMQVGTTGTSTTSSSVPRSEQPQRHSPNHALHVEENWGPFFLQVLGGGGGNGTAQSPSDNINSNNTGNHQNLPVNAPSQPMSRTMVAHHQITLLPMGQRLEHGQDAANNRYNQYLENISSSRTVDNVGNSSNNNNSSSNDTTSRRETNMNNEQLHASYFLEMFPFTGAAQNRSNTNQSSLLSRLESDRRHQRQQAAVGMNDVPPEQQAQSLSFESMAARRRFLMDDYFDVQAHLSMMDNDVDGRRTQPVVATNGGHTVETAIEITEEEDDMDDDDDVIVLT